MLRAFLVALSLSTAASLAPAVAVRPEIAVVSSRVGQIDMAVPKKRQSKMKTRQRKANVS